VDFFHVDTVFLRRLNDLGQVHTPGAVLDEEQHMHHTVRASTPTGS
jgi:hypothetical protein